MKYPQLATKEECIAIAGNEVLLPQYDHTYDISITFAAGASGHFLIGLITDRLEPKPRVHNEYIATACDDMCNSFGMLRLSPEEIKRRYPEFLDREKKYHVSHLSPFMLLNKTNCKIKNVFNITRESNTHWYACALVFAKHHLMDTRLAKHQAATLFTSAMLDIYDDTKHEGNRHVINNISKITDHHDYLWIVDRIMDYFVKYNISTFEHMNYPTPGIYAIANKVMFHCGPNPTDEQIEFEIKQRISNKITEIECYNTEAIVEEYVKNGRIQHMHHIQFDKLYFDLIPQGLPLSKHKLLRLAEYSQTNIDIIRNMIKLFPDKYSQLLEFEKRLHSAVKRLQGIK